jgi:hypothetical protein
MRRLPMAAALAAAALAGTSACGASGGGGAAATAATAEPQAPKQALVEPVDPARPRTWPANGETGRTYPYDLYTRCGIEWAEFAGRTWRAEAARPEPMAKPAANGLTVYSGYTAGSLTLLDADTAYFLIDLRWAEAGDATVVFRPSKVEAPTCK